VRQRSLAYITVAFTLLFPLFGALWARSYAYDDLLFRVGHGRALMLSCVRGELALWTGPARETGPVRYAHQASDTGYAMRAAELLAYDGTAQSYWGAGFGYARTDALAPRELGPVRCFVVPLWFLTLGTAAFPVRIMLKRVRRNRSAVEAELALCRRCGAHLDVGETRCGACSFPAFIRRSVVA
jgi:hypothetical protein